MEMIWFFIILSLILIVAIYMIYYYYNKNWPLNFSLKNVSSSTTYSINVFLNDSKVYSFVSLPNSTQQINLTNPINQRTQQPFQRQDINGITIQILPTNVNNSQFVPQLILSFGNIPTNRTISMSTDQSGYNLIDIPQGSLNQGAITSYGYFIINLPKGIPLM